MDQGLNYKSNQIKIFTSIKFEQIVKIQKNDCFKKSQSKLSNNIGERVD